MNLKAQNETLTFRTGDHIYWMETVLDPPKHYQVDRENDLEGLAGVCNELTRHGVPELILAYDAHENRLYAPGLPISHDDSCPVVYTPMLAKATSWRLETSHRVFVIITKPHRVKSL